MDERVAQHITLYSWLLVDFPVLGRFATLLYTWVPRGAGVILVRLGDAALFAAKTLLLASIFLILIPLLLGSLFQLGGLSSVDDLVMAVFLSNCFFHKQKPLRMNFLGSQENGALI